MELTKSKLSVEERIGAALKLLQVIDPGVPISVSRLAKVAKVSRANLYVSHPDLITSLKHPAKRRSSQQVMPAREQLEKMRAELEQSRLENRALLYLTGELREEIQRLRVRLENLPRRKPKKPGGA